MPGGPPGPLKAWTSEPEAIPAAAPISALLFATSGAIGIENHHGLLSVEVGIFTNDLKRFPISQVKR